MYKNSYILIIFAMLSLNSFTSAASNSDTASVSGFARSFISNRPIANATITIVETGRQMKTGPHGQFGPFSYPIGKPITLMMTKPGYKTTQSATIIVPPNGLNGPYDNITFQVPSIESYYLLAAIVGATIDDTKCHVATTITAHHKILDDVPQGEPAAIAIITPNIPETPFYFNIFKSGLLKGKTNPFTKGLSQTTEDGGVAFFNLPPNERPYTLSAVKAGVTFSKAQFICRKGVFINVSPPQGPMIMK